jgi:hypothetical protein
MLLAKNVVAALGGVGALAPITVSAYLIGIVSVAVVDGISRQRDRILMPFRPVSEDYALLARSGLPRYYALLHSLHLTWLLKIPPLNRLKIRLVLAPNPRRGWRRAKSDARDSGRTVTAISVLPKQPSLSRSRIVDIVAERRYSQKEFQSDLKDRIPSSGLMGSVINGITALPEQEVKYWIGKNVKRLKWPNEVFLPSSQDGNSVSPELEQALWDDILSWGKRNAVIRSVIIEAVVDAEAYDSRLQADLRTFPESLVQLSPSVYERWDRLQSEGEFRRSMSPPLVTLAISWSLVGLISPVLGGCLLLGSIVLFGDGLRKGRAAESQLLTALESGVIESKLMDDLTKGQIQFRYESRVAARDDAIPGEQQSTTALPVH